MAKLRDRYDPFSCVRPVPVLGGVVLVVIPIVTACVTVWDLLGGSRVWRLQSDIVAVNILCAVIGVAILCRAVAVQSRRVARQAAELARTIEALHESEARFHDIVELSGDWIWETGPDHRFTFLAPATAPSRCSRPSLNP
jgi:PAS domain-containing protein